MKKGNAARLTGVSRRGFLAGAGTLGLAGACAGMAGTSKWLVSSAQADEPANEYFAYTYHQSHCGNKCALKCTVRDGRLACIEPNDAMAERRYQTLCLKGISEVQHIYGDHRIQTPLKRAGERGENKFEPVTWEDALDDIASQIKDIQKKYGKDAVLVNTSAEADAPFLSSILEARTLAQNNNIDTGLGNGLDPATGLGWGFCASVQEPRDWVNSRLVINIGNNFCESSLANARVMFDAMDAGARVVDIDPHYSTTASKASEWIPIEVGTDAALFLGMISHILENDLGDSDFMAHHTSLPFLVDVKTGKLMRSTEAVVDEEAKAAAEALGSTYSPLMPFLVVDADGQVKSYLQATQPKLDAEATVEGAAGTTVYNLLLESQKDYPTSWASKITGIPQEKIESLAAEYALGPSCISLGWGGNDKLANADIAGHAAAVLTAITGNFGKHGAGVGVYIGASDNGHAAAFGEWALPATLAPSAADMTIRQLRDADVVHAIVSVGDLLQQKAPNMRKTEEWVKTLDLVVQADPYFTEACKWADYVLPLTTRFEYDAEVGNVKTGYNHICLQEKVIEPLFEAKTDLWFQRELAKRMGHAKALPETADERVKAIMAGCSENVTLKQLLDNQGVWPITGIEKPRMVATTLTFGTESGNMDVYYEDLISYEQELPRWEACNEIYAGNPLREKYPFQLSNTRTRFRIHNQFNDAKWIDQYYTACVYANPSDLASLGIASGETVRVFNDRGEVRVPVLANDAMRPGSVRMNEGMTADYTLAGNIQSLTNDTSIKRGAALMMGPIAAFSDTLVGIEKA